MTRRYGPIAPPPLLLPQRKPVPATNVLEAMEWLPKAETEEGTGIRVILRHVFADEATPEAET